MFALISMRTKFVDRVFSPGSDVSVFQVHEASSIITSHFSQTTITTSYCCSSINDEPMTSLSDGLKTCDQHDCVFERPPATVVQNLSKWYWYFNVISCSWSRNAYRGMVHLATSS